MKNVYATLIVFGVAALVILVPARADEGPPACCHLDDGSCKSVSCPMNCDGSAVCAYHSYCSGIGSLCRLPNDECAWVDEICWVPLECVYDKTCLWKLHPAPSPEEPQNVCWAEEVENACWADDDTKEVDE